MLINYKEYATTRGLLTEAGTAPGVDYNAIITSLGQVADALEVEVDKIFAVAHAQITGHVRLSMRNNQGTWTKLRNWWQTTWHGKDRNTIESVGNLRLELPGLITLHEQEVLNELMQIMEAGPINQALATMAPMLENLKMKVKERIRAAITKMAKQLQIQAQAQAQAQPQQTPQQPTNNPSPPAGPGPAGGGTTGAPPVGGDGSFSTSTSTGGGFPSFSAHIGQPGNHSFSTHTSTGDEEEDGEAPNPAKPDGPPPQPAPTTAPEKEKGKEEPAPDRDDLLAAAGRPGGIDGTPDDKKDKEAEMGAPPTPTSRTKPPELKFEPEDSNDEDDDEEYEDEEGGKPDDEENAPYDDDDDDNDQGTNGPFTVPIDDDDDDDEEGTTNPPSAASGNSSLADQIAAIQAKLRGLPSKDHGIPHIANGRSIAPDDETDDDDDNVDPYDNYEPPSGNTAARRKSADSTGNRTEWTTRINALMQEVPDGPAKEFAKSYTSLKGGPSIKERDKFYNFVRQLTGNNPAAKKILMDPEFGARYKEIASKIDDPYYMGKIGNRIQFSFFYPAQDNPQGFYGHLDRILQDQGIRNGVKMPKEDGRAPKGSISGGNKSKGAGKGRGKKVQAESIQYMKEEYLRRLREVNASTLRSKVILDLSHLPIGEQVQAYKQAMKQR